MSFFDREASLPKAVPVYGPGPGPPVPMPWKEDSWRMGFKPPGARAGFPSAALPARRAPALRRARAQPPLPGRLVPALRSTHDSLSTKVNLAWCAILTAARGQLRKQA